MFSYTRFQGTFLFLPNLLKKEKSMDKYDKYVKIGSNCYGIEPCSEKDRYCLVNIFTKEYIGLRHKELMNVRRMSRRKFVLKFVENDKVLIQYPTDGKILSAGITKGKCLLSADKSTPFDCISSENVSHELLGKAIDSISALSTEIQNIRNILQYNFPPSNVPQAVGKLRQYQEENARFLAEFDNLCSKQGISFWLTAGTLLGAVRHKGFIPWDDDVDVCMMADDFQKLKACFSEQKRFFTTEPNGDQTLSDIKGMVLIDFYPGSYKLKMLNNGEFEPFIDIFVNYNVPADHTLDDQYKAIKTIKRNLDEILQKEGVARYKETLISEQNKITSAGKTEFVYWGMQFARIERAPKNFYKFVFPTEDIFPLTRLTFENHEFNVPKNYVKHLTDMYGDFNSYPNKLAPKHNFREVTPCL